MQRRRGHRILVNAALAGCGIVCGCFGAAEGQSGGNGSVIVHAGDGSGATSPDGTVQISASALEAQVSSKADPEYPMKAKRARVSGAVILAVRVDKEGRVQSARPVSGPEPLRDAAAEAVRRWRYKPYVVKGESVAMASTVTVNFYLER